MVFEIGVEPSDESIEQHAPLARQPAVLRAREPRNLQRAIAPVARHPALPFHLGTPADRADIVVLDAPEVVLGLRICKAEHRGSICLAEHVGDTVCVPINCDLGCEIVLRGELGNAKARRADAAADYCPQE